MRSDWYDKRKIPCCIKKICATLKKLFSKGCFYYIIDSQKGMISQMRSFTILHNAGLRFLMCCACMLCPICTDAQAQIDGSTMLTSVVLIPGDSRSFDFEFDGTLGKPQSTHITAVAAIAPDMEIHQLTVSIAPVGSAGSEIFYVTGGIFLTLTGGAFDFVEIVEPKYTSALDSVAYLIDVNPYMSTGIIVVSAVAQFDDFEFPLEMSMTLTLSN